MKKFLKKIIVGLRTNYIYFSAILLSIILFIFSFIVNEKLYNIFLSIGAIVFGASILGFLIEYSNKKALKEKNNWRIKQYEQLNKRNDIAKHHQKRNGKVFRHIISKPVQQAKQKK